MKTLHLQGLGRLSLEDQQAARHDIWHAIEDVLAVRRDASKRKTESKGSPFWYFGHEDAIESDAVLFVFINSSLISDSSPESGKFMRGLPAVIDYAERIHDLYLPGCEHWTV